jgi:septal ring factor EnvC (AmiA/AmiB activator)
LKKRRRNELEILLSAFDQNNRDENSKHILNVNEEEIPEKYRPLFRRLKMAASSKEVKDQMKKEDGVLNYIKNWARVEANKAIKEKDEEMIKTLADKDEVIAEMTDSLSEKDKALDESNKALEKSNKENEALRREIERLKNENHK